MMQKIIEPLPPPTPPPSITESRTTNFPAEYFPEKAISFVYDDNEQTVDHIQEKRVSARDWRGTA